MWQTDSWSNHIPSLFWKRPLLSVCNTSYRCSKWRPTSNFWTSDWSFSMFWAISVSRGSTLVGSPIWGFLMYTSFILVRASLAKEEQSSIFEVVRRDNTSISLLRETFFFSGFKESTSGPSLFECPYSGRLSCPAASSSSVLVAGGWSLLVRSPEKCDEKGEEKETTKKKSRTDDKRCEFTMSNFDDSLLAELLFWRGSFLIRCSISLCCRKTCCVGRNE